MIRAFIEFFFPVLVFLLIVSLAKTFLRSIGAAMNPAARPGPRPGPPPVQAGGELKKDPVCGTYVSTATSITRNVNGHPVYFCSEECSRKFKA